MYRQHRYTMDKFAEPPHVGDRAIVIASGPSGAGPWPTHPGVPVIAVAGAVEGLGFAPDFWFTLDPSPKNMERLRALHPDTTPIIACDPDMGPDAANPRYRQDFGRALLLCLRRESEDRGDRRILTFGNSGRAAVHLAKHMGAKRIAVFGVDGTTDPHWYDPEQKSGHLKSLGKSCALLSWPDVELVFADSGKSTVQGQTRATPEATLAWIQQALTPADAVA